MGEKPIHTVINFSPSQSPKCLDRLGGTRTEGISETSPLHWGSLVGG